MKILKTAKGFFPFKATFFVLLWGSFATLRRVLAVVAMFIPSFGLFSILYHWQAEKIPFKMRLDYARKFGVSPEDKIGLFGLNETVYWSELDRWTYEDALNPVAPHYSLYTGLSLKMTFVAFFVISTVQFFFVWFVKNRTSEEFRNSRSYFAKFTHVVLNLNLAFPYKDWDEGKHTIEEYKERFRRTKIEMLASLMTNFVISLVMLTPLLITGNVSYREPYLKLCFIFNQSFNFGRYQDQRKTQLPSRTAEVYTPGGRLVFKQNQHNSSACVRLCGDFQSF